MNIDKSLMALVIFISSICSLGKNTTVAPKPAASTVTVFEIEKEPALHSLSFSPDALSDFHDAHVETFDESAGFGVRRIAIMPLAIGTDKIAISSTPNQNGKSEPFYLGKRELIGLVVSAKPTVYDTTNITRLKAFARSRKTANLKTRDLDKIEATALTRLQAGEEIIVTKAAERVSIVGAIRAKQDCTTCHECNVGTLLGAFSYQLIGAAEWKSTGADIFKQAPAQASDDE